MSIPTLVTFAIYTVGMLVIGIYFYRKTTNLSDYILGGRGLAAPVAALSSGASDMSGWLLLGLPGALYASGLVNIWISIGLTLGALLNWILVAPRLRTFTELASDSITIPDYLENRFSDHSRVLRIISAFVILVFFSIYTSSGLVSGAILFENSFNLDYYVALWGGAIVIVSYTFLGGFNAVSWTDFFQGLLMLLALLLVPIILTTQLGGFSNVIAQVSEMSPSHLNFVSGVSLVSILSLSAWGLGYFGQPHILVRFMSIKSVKEIPKARAIAMTWMILSLMGAMLVGFFGVAYFADKPLDNSEIVFIHLTQVLFNPWITGILLAAIFAAIMSTIDSQLLVCSSTITEDFYKAFFRRNATQQELVWVGRTAVLAIALLAVYLAHDRQNKVLDLVAYAWAGFGAAFGPIILLSLFWKRMTSHGATAGMIIGAITVIVWKQLEGGVFDIYEILPAFILATVGIIVVSLLGKRPPQEAEQLFDRGVSAVNNQDG